MSTIRNVVLSECDLLMTMLTMIKITVIKMMEVNLLILSKCDLLRGNKSDGAECHVAVRTCLGKKTINKMLKAGGTIFFVKDYLCLCMTKKKKMRRE